MPVDDLDFAGENNSKTVILVFAADRGHFNCSIPLSKELRRRGFFVELWTHALTRSWYEKESFDVINESLGSGEQLNMMVKLYKQSSSLGEGDNGSKSMMLRECPSLMANAGLSWQEMDDYMASKEGREAFQNRLKDRPPSIVVWEATFCKWVTDICTERGVPCYGLAPSPYYPFRCHYSKMTNTKMLEFDGSLHIRDIEKDSDPVTNKHPYAHIVAQILLQGAFVRSNASRLGFFLPSRIDKDMSRGVGDECLTSWLNHDTTPVILISLGSQSALAALGDAVGMTLVKGALRANTRVVFVGDKTDLNSSNKNIARDRGYCTSSIQQWEVLNHPNVKAFVTHCGSNSAHEGLYAGVPMIPLPFFDDQYYIAENLEMLYGYSDDCLYSPLRKVDIRTKTCKREDELDTHKTNAINKICNAIKLALKVPREKLENLRMAVEEEDGVKTAGEIIAKLAIA